MFETTFLKDTENHYHKEGQQKVTSEEYSVREHCPYTGIV